jgi:hypothetical protein
MADGTDEVEDADGSGVSSFVVGTSGAIKFAVGWELTGVELDTSGGMEGIGGEECRRGETGRTEAISETDGTVLSIPSRAKAVGAGLDVREGLPPCSAIATTVVAGGGTTLVDLRPKNEKRPPDFLTSA